MVSIEVSNKFVSLAVPETGFLFKQLTKSFPFLNHMLRPHIMANHGIICVAVGPCGHHILQVLLCICP